VDIKINPSTGDLELSSTGDIQWTSEAEAVAQRLRIRLQFFKGEWFADTRVGIPYYSDILLKNPSKRLVLSIMSEVILGTPGIARLVSLDYTLSRPTRELSLVFVAETTEGFILDSQDFGPFIVAGSI
jgi:hypothetical protein